MTDHMGLIPMSAELTMFYTDFTSSLAFAAQQERERIIKLLKKEAEHHKQISESISMDEYMSESDSESEWWASVVLDKFADALIKGEQK